ARRASTIGLLASLTGESGRHPLARRYLRTVKERWMKRGNPIMRYTCASAGILAVLSAIAPLTAFAQVQGLSVTTYQLVSEERSSRNESALTYRADLVNPGPARTAITATVFSTVPAVQTVPGQTNLHFAPVPASSQVTSNNTFTILVDRTVDFSFSSLQWS